MKLYTPDNTELLDVTSVSRCADGVEIEGTIMGAMPMRAVLRPAELRRGISFLSPALVWTLFGMLLRKG